MKGGKRDQTGGPSRINSEIRGQEVSLKGLEGEQLGIVSLREALEKAEEAGVDLVEISPNAEPPACRIREYGNFPYAKSKSSKEHTHIQKVIQVKEHKLRPGPNECTMNCKLPRLYRF
ncbi:translation initiation factor IF-3, partial [Salmonella enterica]|uniref:translation initiation factor IF-3 n=1 Tax=Salmonella enterica TaxID=28901 RepID=UPI00398C77B1